MIRIHHVSVRIAKEGSLLNAVEKIPVATLGFQLFTNVDEHMDGVCVRSVIRGYFRRGDQKATVRQEFDGPFDNPGLVRAKWTMSGGGFAFGSEDFVDGAPNQPGWMNS